MRFWLLQDLRSIYQSWKQPTSIPYGLFFGIKTNSFIHSKFYVNFLSTYPTKTKQYFSTNQIVKMTSLDQPKYDDNFR